MTRMLLLLIAVACSMFCGTLCGRSDTENAPPPPPRHPPPPPPPPPPPRPPPLVPDGSSRESTTPTPSSTPPHIPPPPLEPVPLQPNQCTFGSGTTDAVDSAEGYAEANILFVLANSPAKCSGVVHSVEICFYIREKRKIIHTFQILSFRLINSQSYRKVSATSAGVEISFFNSESGDAICQIIELNETLGLREGDFLGFITEQGFNIAFIMSDDGGIFQYIPSEDDTLRKSRKNQDFQSFPAAQLKQANITATPVLKIIMNTTETTSFPTPTVTPSVRPDSDSCNGEESSRKRTVSVLTFAAAMTASAVMIVALVVAVLILCCCLCGCCDCQMCKSLTYLKKGKRAQKVGGIEHSLQYNEQYLQTDPAKVITGGEKQMTMLYKNPAYGQPTTSQTPSDHDKRGLDHTYESVEVARVT